MTIKFIKDGAFFTPDERQFFDGEAELTFEWKEGQYWLHSDDPKERPIGIEIDRELERHEKFFRQSSLHKELLAKAIGVKGSYRPSVLDLTGGLLGDTLLFLAFGCEVYTCERHPVIRFLIESALKNAKHPKLDQFHFLPYDAMHVLQQMPPVEVIFFDPMYEDASSKTSPRKEMRIFRSVVGKDADAEEVFLQAMANKPKRLVVKRPKQSAVLGLTPSVEYPGKSTRYDVYFSL